MSRRLFVPFALALTALAATPSPAGAEPAPEGTLAPLTPFAGARAAAGTRLTFRVRIPPGVAQPVAIVVSAAVRGAGGAPRAGARVVSGEARAGALDPFIVEWRPAGAAARALRRPGRYRWQAVATRVGAGPALRSPPRALVIASRGRDDGAIPRRIGRHGRLAFRISLRGVPETVGATRFVALAARSGRRWGLRPLGTTRRRAGVRDGVSVVGFSESVPPRALGVTTAYRVARYRALRRCGPAGCRTVGRPRLIDVRVVERDVALNPDVPWQRGPAHPSSDEFDLETVLLHEFGHAAGNPRHARRCADSPMIATLSSGDWWRSPSDFSFRRCGEASTAGAALPVRERLVGREYEAASAGR